MDPQNCPVGDLRTRGSARSARYEHRGVPGRRRRSAQNCPVGGIERLPGCACSWRWSRPRTWSSTSRSSWRRGGRRRAFRWTVPDQWHLTLAFAANVPDRSYDDLVARLTRAAAKRRPMQARIAGGGAFPNVGRAKVLFAGIETASTGGRRRGAPPSSHRRPGRPGEGRRRGGRPAVPGPPHPGADGPPGGGDQLGPAARRLRRPALADRGARPRRLTPRGGPAAAAAPRGGRDVQSRPRW